MASPKSHNSRRRGSATVIKESTTEDQALTTIAKEAEARLAAKRAARAEARSIRMKEIERRQKEAADNNAGSDADSVEEYKYSRALSAREYTSSPTHGSRASSLTNGSTRDYERASSLTNGSSSREHSRESSITNGYSDHSISKSINYANECEISRLKECVKDGEEKYKKAMVNAAQLDNERQALVYHVEILKDIIEELQEKIENTNDELLQKCREYNKLGRELNTTASELKKCMFIVEERERILFENGINIDGTIKEGYTLPTSSVHCSLCSASLNDDIYTVDDHRERGSLLAEVASLKSEIEDLKKKSNSEQSRRELESTKRNMQQQILELKTQIQVLEQQNAQKEGLVVRLETQVRRYKQQADAAESVEDNLLADKRKISRELRQCQEQIIELENEKEQLKKRLEKLKSRRGIDV